MAPHPRSARLDGRSAAAHHGTDAAWPLLAELAWLAPARFADLAQRLADAPLARLLKRFGEDFGGEGDVTDFAWFPAWALTEQPLLAGRLALAQASLGAAPERAMRLLLELLGLERQGRHHEIVERRRALRGLQPALYAAYMRVR